MAKLIDKNALVAEIYNIESSAICEYKSQPSRYNEGCIDVIHRIKSFIDTLEVKEEDDMTANGYVKYPRKEFF